MKVKDVIVRLHGQVPFPWSVRKIKKAGLDPVHFLLEAGQLLEGCEDKDTPGAKAVLEVVHDLSLLNV